MNINNGSLIDIIEPRYSKPNEENKIGYISECVSFFGFDINEETISGLNVISCLTHTLRIRALSNRNRSN